MPLSKFIKILFSAFSETLSSSGIELVPETSEEEEPKEHRSLTNRPTVEALDDLIGETIKVGPHGFIRLIDYMGGDDAITQAARVSYGAGTTSKRGDRALIRYLMSNGHWSPFEMPQIKFHVKLPIFVARQWIRHKFHLNEYSARYSIMSDEFYVPDISEIGAQSKSNKQGTNTSAFGDEKCSRIQHQLEYSQTVSSKDYEYIIKEGSSRELARICKSLGSYTEWYMETNLRDLLHFIRQRSDSHAQQAIREYSDTLRDTFLKVWAPSTYEAYIDYIQNSLTLSGPQLAYLDFLLAKAYNSNYNGLEFKGELSKREREAVEDIVRRVHRGE